MKAVGSSAKKAQKQSAGGANLPWRGASSLLCVLFIISTLFLFGCDMGKEDDTEGGPTVSINGEGYWVIDGKATDVKAKGEDGEDGKDGADGSSWTVGTTFPLSPKKNDMFLNNTSWKVYQYNGSKWVLKGSLISDDGTASTIVDLVMFMGQSNMAGRGDYTAAPSVPVGHGYEFRAVSDATRLYDIGSLPFGKNENRGVISETTKTGSMVPALMNSYYEYTGVPIVGVSASKGGTGIDWWQPGGDALNEAIARYKAARTYLSQNGYTVRHQYMVWCQGETDGDNSMLKDAYKLRLSNMVNEMHRQGIEKTMLVRIGNHRDNATLYDGIILAQTELCEENEDVVMISARLAGMASEGLMKDKFHYTQDGYNTVGADAGKNMAYYVNSGMEPYFFDSEYKCYYPFAFPYEAQSLTASVKDGTHNFSEGGIVSSGKVTVSAKSSTKKISLTRPVVLSDGYSWTLEAVIGNMTSGTTVLASAGGAEATGFISVPNASPQSAGSTAQFRFRDLGKTFQVDFTLPSGFNPSAKNHLAITYDAQARTIKGYLNKQELSVSYTVGSQASGFNDTPLTALIGGYVTEDYNFKGDFYYFAFHKRVLITSEMYASN